MNKITNLRSLYDQISKKSEFILMLSKDLKLDYEYLRDVYFRNGWNILEIHQDRIIELLHNTIRLQRK